MNISRIVTPNILFVLFFILGCSSEEEQQTEQTGNLTVFVGTSNESPESNARVTLTPGNITRMTNSTGETDFENLAVGIYNILVEVSEASPNYTEGLTYEVNDISIIENQTQTVDVLILEGSGPIEETDVSIDFLLTETYNRLRNDSMFDVSGYLQYWGDTGTDIAYVSSTAPLQLLALDRYDILSSNPIINDVWSIHYQIIRNTNVALEAIADSEYVSESGKEENVIIAEFRFLRALCYFNLLKLFGNPVLVTSTDVNAIFEQNREGVKALIEEDLQYAAMNLEIIQFSNMASSDASKALLGKFYLYCAGFPDFDADKYPMAKEQLEGVLNSFSLEEEYSAIFDVDNEANNNEVIFSIGFEGSENNGGGDLGIPWGPRGYAVLDYLLLDGKFIQEFFNDESDFQNPATFPLAIDDERFYSNIASFTVDGSTTQDASNVEDWRPLKYIADISTSPVQGASSVDFPYLRYADVLLMLAEIENAMNGPTTQAYEYVNQVINRSHPSNEFELPTGLSQTEFLLEILKQRRKELCFEGQYKDDLIRNGLLEDVINDFNTRNPSLAKQFDAHEYIWPIPQSEINLNPNVTQNPGY